jgi:hypothetical protein
MAVLSASSPSAPADRPPLDNDAVLTALHAYWNHRRRGRAVPDRRDIDPVDIGPRLLPNVALVDVVDGGARFRNRLVGTAIVERWGVEITGRFLDETMRESSYRNFIHELYRDACRFRAPVYSSSLFRWDVGSHMVTRRLYLPLTHGGGDVAMILVGQTFIGTAPGPVKAYRAVFDQATIEQQRREILGDSARRVVGAD